MAGIALFFGGSVLLLNGLALLGRVTPRATVPLNLLVALTLVAAVPLELPAQPGVADPRGFVLAGGNLLFAFTYVQVAATSWFGWSPRVVGWYCGWAAVAASGVALACLGGLDDVRLGVLWCSWTVLFASYFLLFALEQTWLTTFTGRLTVLQSVSTATLPGAAMVVREWDDIDPLLVAAAQGAVLLVLLPTLVRARRVDLRPA